MATCGYCRRHRRSPAFARTPSPTRSQAATVADSRTRRLATYTEAGQSYLAGQTLAAIGWAMYLAPSTERRYAHAASCPEQALLASEPSLLDPFILYLEARVAEGCKNAAQLWREFVAGGYAGTKSQVSRWLRPCRTQRARNTPRGGDMRRCRGMLSLARALPSPTPLK